MRAIMNICVSSLACLSFSLRPPPPSPRLLSSSVVFEMLRGSLNSVSVSGCCAAHKKRVWTRFFMSQDRAAINRFLRTRKYSFSSTQSDYRICRLWTAVFLFETLES